ncbi:MAG: hypothetical protein ACI9LO_003367 [Planctomycetota bacterium]
MFWKKKKNPDFGIETQHEDIRSAYRVAPDRSRPVLVSILGNSFNVLNVSGSGVAFRSHNYPVGAIINATIKLPSEDIVFPVALKIVSKQSDLCRCEFREIHPDAENLLHSYILELQKRKIRQTQGRTYG